ncbi:MAG: arginine--tRNA ligase [Bacillota bacterium]|uniref:Arginine--tRNA ligase n=1 Tax=Virgibacillus salarius TaxID=447199 RepID=A0A941DZ63_9BACI|nr:MULTISPECIES: arginine--tRNA ligase [Virgibacillus]MBR7798041.1 arginine--tRNA ligase [Virgibacillus salarius]NAZ10750.1 arginine--tRNA ligase [Agaribacter marinus]
MELKQVFANEIVKHSNELLTLLDVKKQIEIPKYNKQGDLAFPCFVLAKHVKENPANTAKKIAIKMKHPLFEQVVANGPYLNCFLNKTVVSKNVMNTILQQGSRFGSLKIGNGENITIDFSSPNIAKPFSMGHLRSTVIGNSYANILEKCGYNPVRINHLGDWGTQFGKLIAAYYYWGDDEQIEVNPIQELLNLYVNFHKEANNDQSLETEARKWFLKLEKRDVKATKLWNWFKEESLKEFKKIYDLLDVYFDSYDGEAFYNDKMDETVNILKSKGLLTKSDGADVVRLDEHDLPPCLIKKSDGATLYATRDLTAAIYRYNKYQFAKSIYVVGHEQSLHFQQVFLVLKKLGLNWAGNMQHLPFGFILKDGKKMSTRKGKVVLLEKVLEEAVMLAAEKIKDRNPNLENQSEIAKDVGIGAVIFHDLKTDRQHNVEFSLEEMLRFEGATGPYIQYTHARACSILRKSEKVMAGNIIGLEEENSWSVIKQLYNFPFNIQHCLDQGKPSILASYLLDLCREFNKYYANQQILTEDEQQEQRIALVHCTAVVIKEGLRLLGIKAPEQM